ncbi:MAG: TetR family transcriptional regulator [Streptosporangiaceae bacterium]
MTTTTAAVITGSQPVSRREQQKEQTRMDLALAAFEQAKAHGVAGVRIPQVAAAVGVSARTFNNYFPSKEAAIVWPATLRAVRMTSALLERPADEPLEAALIAAVTAQYGQDDDDGEIEGMPPGWIRELRALVAAEPALHGEYHKASVVTESALADAIAHRTGADAGDLEPQIIAAVVIGAERAAVRHWARQASKQTSLADAVGAGLTMALRGLTSPAV